jgi:hypothetical protein
MRDEFALIQAAIDKLELYEVRLPRVTDLNVVSSAIAVVPFASTVVSAWALNETVNATAATILTFSTSAGTIVETLSIASAAAAQAVTSASFVSGTGLVVPAGGWVKATSNGGGSGVMAGTVTVLLRRTA